MKEADQVAAVCLMLRWNIRVMKTAPLLQH